MNPDLTRAEPVTVPDHVLRDRIQKVLLQTCIVESNTYIAADRAITGRQYAMAVAQEIQKELQR